MTKLDVEQNKQRDMLYRRHLLRLLQLDRQHIQDSRRRLMAIPDEEWNQAMANDQGGAEKEE